MNDEDALAVVAFVTDAVDYLVGWPDPDPALVGPACRRMAEWLARHGFVDGPMWTALNYTWGAVVIEAAWLRGRGLTEEHEDWRSAVAAERAEVTVRAMEATASWPDIDEVWDEIGGVDVSERLRRGDA